MDAQPEYKSPVGLAERALRQLIDSRDNVERLEVRLEIMLSRWSRLEEQHARALADLERAAGRLQELEARLQQQSRAPEAAGQAASGELMSAVKALLESFERIEAHLGSREEQLARWMDEARIDLRDLVAVGSAQVSTTANRGRHAANAAEETANGRGSLRGSSRGTSRGSWSFWIALAALAATILALAALLTLRGHLREADAHVQAAETQSRAIQDRVARELADMQTAAARETAVLRVQTARTATMAAVLAAPDVVRFYLIGTAMAPGARGEALWSRSRGVVLTASGLPPPPLGYTYTLWVATPIGGARLGTAEVDEMGRLTFARDTAPSASGPIFGLFVTAEAADRGGAPSEPAYLVTRKAG